MNPGPVVKKRLLCQTKLYPRDTEDSAVKQSAVFCKESNIKEIRCLKQDRSDICNAKHPWSETIGSAAETISGKDGFGWIIFYILTILQKSQFKNAGPENPYFSCVFCTSFLQSLQYFLLLDVFLTRILQFAHLI